ncbi:MAG: UTP--glucose-1-phosphate uridylyltransferase [Phycisphaerales bacterium]|nr:MAG: UTP--glucose-1-phosphate uridylyltransferase [Phycisphaerales bacterium]
MPADRAYEETKELLKRYNQDHLLTFWDRLDPQQQENLLTQIGRLDLEVIHGGAENNLRKPADKQKSGGQSSKEPIQEELDPDALTPAPYYAAHPVGPEQEDKYQEAVKTGAKLISEGKVAALVVAGGQGTRLRFDDPKGNFPISPVKGKTFFRIFAETIAAVSRKFDAVCPWYVMTSPLNHDRTAEIFRQNGFYGLKEADVFIFEQGTLPSLDPEGRIQLAAMDKIVCSPDGHGGTFKALAESGALEDIKSRGVEYISYWQVDNPLVKLFDPLFIGLHVLDRAQMSSKAVIKSGPFEKVGNFCLLNEKLNVIEYSEFNEMLDNQAPPGPDGEKPKLAERMNPDGSLVFRLGSIAIHIISTDFVGQLNAAEPLPLHRARKKISCIDLAGDSSEPSERDGIKLERFIFDALPRAANSVILETIREQEFAPTKNATGVDSVQTTKRMITARAADWLEAAGVNIPKESVADCLLEIAPAFALEKDDVGRNVTRIPRIKPGDELYLA